MEAKTIKINKEVGYLLDQKKVFLYSSWWSGLCRSCPSIYTAEHLKRSSLCGPSNQFDGHRNKRCDCLPS